MSRTFRVNEDGSIFCAGLASMGIPVAAANQPPTVNRIPGMIVYVKEPVRFPVAASDPDNTPLTCSARGLPADI